MKLIEDLGMKYPTENSKKRRRFGIYECPGCNAHIERATTRVKNKSVTQCKSCASKKNAKKHGGYKTRLYGIWQGMKTRCYTESDYHYRWYGDRGIKICEEWFNNFQKFQDWSLKNGYEEALTIDRRNNDKNYEPSNCKWVDKTTQARNTRKIRNTNTSGNRGVHAVNKKWRSVITVNNQKIHLGYHKKKLQAAKAYDIYVITNNLEHTINGVLYSNIKDNHETR